jgi:LuxR family maltose regulon positive regulatory protein
MVQLLRVAAGRGYAERGDAAARALLASTPESAAVLALLDPLSARELDVLRLLAGKRSQSEIAQALTVSVNTVRSHVKHIYDKLDVHSRHEAVERARELGLL